MAYGTDTAIIKDFINEAVEHCMKKDSNLISIYEQHRWGLGWTKAQSKKPRELESVVLNSNLQQELITDIKRFQNSAQWYMDKGVPYRRGYLLYGPPGTGKTSFTTAIAGALKLNICYLNLSSGNMDDDGLNRALNNAPSQSIILLEDIDGIFVSRESVNQNEEGRRVSFSGLLNALDGVRS
jgi:chaperone BCS1